MQRPLASLATLLLLAAPAVAQPGSSSSPAPPRPAPNPVAVKLTVKVGADTRVHELVMFDEGCSKVVDKSSAYEDEINVCARPAPAGVMFDVAWRTRTGPTEYFVSTAGVVKRGGRMDIGRAAGPHFTLSL